ncbi:MAG TPA: hypothetical protein V6C91_07635 [Coleofasciculaceae cyanobacterium]
MSREEEAKLYAIRPILERKFYSCSGKLDVPEHGNGLALLLTPPDVGEQLSAFIHDTANLRGWGRSHIEFDPWQEDTVIVDFRPIKRPSHNSTGTVMPCLQGRMDNFFNNLSFGCLALAHGIADQNQKNSHTCKH